MSKKDRRKRFSIAAADLNDSIRSMFIGAIRLALMEGAKEVVRQTHHDSSNAAAQWQIGVTGISEPRGMIKDLRNTHSGGVISELVGFRREGRTINSSPLIEHVVSSISAQMQVNINRYAKGQKPEGRFFYFHPLSEANDDEHYKAAKIKEAGQAGLKRVMEVFNSNIASGNIRKFKVRNY